MLDTYLSLAGEKLDSRTPLQKTLRDPSTDVIILTSVKIEENDFLFIY